jgi:hypothetical protein
MTYVLVFVLVWLVTFALIIGVSVVRKRWKKRGEGHLWELRARKVLNRGEAPEDHESWEENQKINLK